MYYIIWIAEQGQYCYSVCSLHDQVRYIPNDQRSSTALYFSFFQNQLDWHCWIEMTSHIEFQPLGHVGIVLKPRAKEIKVTPLNQLFSPSRRLWGSRLSRGPGERLLLTCFYPSLPRCLNMSLTLTLSLPRRCPRLLHRAEPPPVHRSPRHI